MKGIIPTGGRGTRMQPLTFSSNKHFIPVANKPLIFYPIETVAQTGIKEVFITYNAGHLEEVRSKLGDGGKWGLRFRYVLQEKPLGLANIFQVCEPYLKGESFLLHLGDNIFMEGIKDLVDYFLEHKPNGLIPITRHKENRRLGVPYFDKRGKLIRFVEKPKNPPHDFAIPGLYFFDRQVFKCFKGEDRIKRSSRGEFEIGSSYQWLIDHGFKVEVKEYQGKWLDPGKFDDWIDANQYILDRRLETKIESKLSKDVSLENRISIGKHCKIDKARIRGPVAIGDEVVIKNSHIGPFTSVGDRAVIEGSHVENSVIMSEVKIRNIKQPIDTSLIGPQSQVVNGHGPTMAIRLFVGEKSQLEI